MAKPYFSVVIPCYNRLEPLRETLRSVSRQTMPDFETILVDDCSPLSVEGVFREFAAQAAEVGRGARLIRLPANAGPACARNVGWNEAAGQYVAFLDSDDLWHPQKLAICREMLTRSGAVALYHSFAVLPAGGVSSERRVAEYECTRTSAWRGLIRNYSATPCFVVERDIEERFDESMRYTEDHDLWLRVARRRPMVALLGPPLTFLGRPILSSGGLSAHRWQMRLSECRMYWKYCRGSLLVLVYPLFVLWSLLKHVRSLLNSRPVARAE